MNYSEQTNGRARNTDPHTSHEAAASVDVEGLKAVILKAMEEAGSRGVTNDDCVIITGKHRDSLSPRFAQLLDEGKIAPNGETRTTARGKQALVYVLATDPTAKAPVAKLNRRDAITLAKSLLRSLRIANERLLKGGLAGVPQAAFDEAEAKLAKA